MKFDPTFGYPDDMCCVKGREKLAYVYDHLLGETLSSQCINYLMTGKSEGLSKSPWSKRLARFRLDMLAKDVSASCLLTYPEEDMIPYYVHFKHDMRWVDHFKNGVPCSLIEEHITGSSRRQISQGANIRLLAKKYKVPTDYINFMSSLPHLARYLYPEYYWKARYPELRPINLRYDLLATMPFYVEDNLFSKRPLLHYNRFMHLPPRRQPTHTWVEMFYGVPYNINKNLDWDACVDALKSKSVTSGQLYGANHNTIKKRWDKISELTRDYVDSLVKPTHRYYYPGIPDDAVVVLGDGVGSINYRDKTGIHKFNCNRQSEYDFWITRLQWAPPTLGDAEIPNGAVFHGVFGFTIKYLGPTGLAEAITYRTLHDMEAALRTHWGMSLQEAKVCSPVSHKVDDAPSFVDGVVGYHPRLTEFRPIVTVEDYLDFLKFIGSK